MQVFFELKFEGEFQKIPQRMQESIARYCQHNIKPGTFLSALIQNDLETAVLQADEENYPLLKLYIMWFKLHTANLLGKENFQKHIHK
jgi:hypothetical protein